jgi:hypothetical protein
MADEKKITWEDIKKRGSQHYKTGDVEPIDLYCSLGVLEIFSLCNVIKYAFRNVQADFNGQDISRNDLKKMHHYLDMIEANQEEQ